MGTIVEWVDDKGYGWVKSGDKRYFTHIKDFETCQRRPIAGETVRFIQGIDAKGRMCAKSIAFVKSGGRVEFGTWLLLALLLALPLFALLWMPVPWWQGAGAMLVVSAITYGMYAHDKARAISSGWRVKESALHLAELLGGWPGALLAQRRLRHKCSKGSYQFVFWCIVALFQIASADLILGHRLYRAMLAFITR
jgi:uncharacterized membrane protein YsdA (DUF1294 family)/cold shock CspA family protein